jgi:hypothetical protein
MTVKIETGEVMSYIKGKELGSALNRVDVEKCVYVPEGTYALKINYDFQAGSYSFTLLSEDGCYLVSVHEMMYTLNRKKGRVE